MALSSTQMNQEALRRKLPTKEDSSPKQPIIIGYAHDVKSGRAEQAIKDGAHVVIWSFLHLDVMAQDGAAQKNGFVRTDLDLKEIGALRKKYNTIVHLAAFGGWNGPHPSPDLTGQEWCEVFVEFNKSHDSIFDGIDWDYEGHDDLSNPTAVFTLDTLNIMADFSTHAKQKYDLIVSMAPAESYLDAMSDHGSTDAEFSLRLDLPPRAWTSSQYATNEDRNMIENVGFSHAGRQCYAYVLARAGIDVFDWVSIQLYEAYSPFAHDLSRREIDPVDALMARVNTLVDGYTVTNIPSLSCTEYQVKIPLNKLVIGVGNKWVDGLKFCEVKPESLSSAYRSTLSMYDSGFLGVMFWTIEEEGDKPDMRYTLHLSKRFQSLAEQSLLQEL